MTRLVEWAIVTVWLVSMSWLVAADAVPRWFAEEPPPSASRSWLQLQGTAFQYGVYDDNGPHRGTYWTVYELTDETITRLDYLELHGLQFIGNLMLKSKSVFLEEDQLDSVELLIKGLRADIELRGERQGPLFAFALKIGSHPARELRLDREAARTICDVTKPFSALQNLQVGQSWKIHVLDPFSLIHDARNRKLKDVLVSVTGRETVRIQGVSRDCFVVESDNVKAWVDESGRVLLQEVDIPAIGKIEISEQTFNREKLDAFRMRMDSVAPRSR